MNNRSRFKRVFGVDAERWAKRWDLRPFTHPCHECGRDQTASIPFATARLRGLIAPECECGHPNPPYCCVAVDGGIPVGG